MLSGSAALPPSCQPAPDLGGPLPAAVLVPSPTPVAAWSLAARQGRGGSLSRGETLLPHGTAFSSASPGHVPVHAEPTVRSPCGSQRGPAVLALLLRPSKAPHPPRERGQVPPSPAGLVSGHSPQKHTRLRSHRPPGVSGRAKHVPLLPHSFPAPHGCSLMPSGHEATPGPCPTTRPMTLPLTRPAQLPCLPGLSSGHLTFPDGCYSISIALYSTV